MYSNFVRKIRLLIKSHKFHVVIVTLVIIDCLCIATELLIAELAKHILNEQNHECTEKENLISTNKTHSNNSSDLHDLKPNHNKSQYHAWFNIIESILRHISTLILGLFTIEVIVKLILVPEIFIKSKWEILDAFVVVFSFSINKQ